MTQEIVIEVVRQALIVTLELGQGLFLLLERLLKSKVRQLHMLKMLSRLQLEFWSLTEVILTILKVRLLTWKFREQLKKLCMKTKKLLR